MLVLTAMTISAVMFAQNNVPATKQTPGAKQVAAPVKAADATDAAPATREVKKAPVKKVAHHTANVKKVETAKPAGAPAPATK